MLEFDNPFQYTNRNRPERAEREQRRSSETAFNVPGKYRKYAVADLPRPVSIAGHHEPTPCRLVPAMFPGVTLRIA
jgi:hypothetical protein